MEKSASLEVLLAERASLEERGLTEAVKRIDKEIAALGGDPKPVETVEDSDED